MKKTFSESGLLLIGIFISILAVIAFPNSYFHPDMNNIWKWAQIWKIDWHEIYIACPTCNYPILGMFFSAGLLAFLSNLGFTGSVFIYRIFLAVVDGFNVLLVFWILKRLKAERPAYFAGMIGISISSWVGGALWGQIEGISQLFILLSLVWAVKKNTETHSSSSYYLVYLMVYAVLLACLMLIKQLTIFSVFSIGLLIAADILFHDRAWKPFVLKILLILSVFLVTVTGWDFFLKIKPGYFSHLIYIWQEGFYEGYIISGNGFNIWMLLGRDMWSSAHIPIFTDFPLTNPYRLGQILFLFLAGIITLSLGLFVKDQYKHNETFLNREILLNFILHLALINLCFNLFLTGTRERYLYHFYPYAIVAWVGLSLYSRLFSEKILALLILGASLYGFFVLQIIASLVILPGTETHLIMTVFHLILFISLLIVVLRYQKFIHNISLLIRKNAVREEVATQ